MMQERYRARAANVIIDHSGSGKLIGLASGASPEIMPFRRQSRSPRSCLKRRPPNKPFSRGQDPQVTSRKPTDLSDQIRRPLGQRHLGSGINLGCCHLTDCVATGKVRVGSGAPLGFCAP